MESFNGKSVGEFLSASKVIDFKKRVVQRGEAYPLFLEAIGKVVVTVAIELQSKRRPGRHSQIAKAELGIDEVEVVVEALGLLVS